MVTALSKNFQTDLKMSDYDCDIRKIAELLKSEDQESESDDDLPGVAKISPGDIGKKPHGVTIKNSTCGKSQQDIPTNDPDAIWKAHEVVNQPMGEEIFDPREQPEYEIKYQQTVSPEDVFLQMNGRTSLTSSCENMIVSIYLKGETKSAVDLAITNSTLDIRSPLYRLHLCLPHPVDAEKGLAEWDSKQEVLQVKLLMVREFDFINF